MQQSGRAGRRLKDSLAVLVADSYPIDQYYVTHPEELYEKPNDELAIDLDNKPLLEGTATVLVDIFIELTPPQHTCSAQHKRCHYPMKTRSTLGFFTKKYAKLSS